MDQYRVRIKNRVRVRVQIRISIRVRVSAILDQHIVMSLIPSSHQH